MQQPFEQPTSKPASSHGSSTASPLQTDSRCRTAEDELVSAVEAASKGDTTAQEHSARVDRVRKAVAALNTVTLANLPLPPPTPAPIAPTFDGTPQNRTIGFNVVGAPQRPPLRPSLSALILQAVLSDAPPCPRDIPITIQRDISPSFTVRSSTPAPLRLSQNTAAPLLVLSTSPPSDWALAVGGGDLDPAEVRNWRHSRERNRRKDSWSSSSTLNSRRTSLRLSASSIFGTPSTSLESRSSLAPSLRTHRPIYYRTHSAPTKPRPSSIASATKQRKGGSVSSLSRLGMGGDRGKERREERVTSGERKEGRGAWLVRWVVERFN